MSFEDYALAATVKLPLYDFNGNDTGDWLLVRGVDSDEFQLAQEEAVRARVTLEAIEDKAERLKITKLIRINLLSSLIADWSFSEPVNVDNVMSMLTKAPQIAEAIDAFAGNRENFIAKKSKPLPIWLKLKSSLARGLRMEFRGVNT